MIHESIESTSDDVESDESEARDFESYSFKIRLIQAQIRSKNSKSSASIPTRRSNQILNVETSVIHHNTVMFTNSTDHTVFHAVGNVIPCDKETYVEDL